MLNSPALSSELVALFETLVNVMFCVKDANGVYVEVNTAFVRRTGRGSKREVIGKKAQDLFAPERAELYEEQDRRVIAGDGVLRDELELIRRPDGGLGWYLTTKRAVPGENDGTPIGLVSVSRDLETRTDDGEAVQSLQPFVSHVRSNLQGQLRTTELAEVVGCTPDQLDRRVRKVFGISPKQYVLRVKVERAMELLSSTQEALSDVAVESGFYDQSDFSKRFARITGRTPLQYRATGSDLPG